MGQVLKALWDLQTFPSGPTLASLPPPMSLLPLASKQVLQHDKQVSQSPQIW
jgi:hypothetical protein